MTKKTSPLGLKVKNRLDEIRETQTWLAEQLGLSNNAVSKWISGASEPKFSNLCDMAKHLKCSVGYLAGDSDHAPSGRILTKDQETLLAAFEASGDDQKDEWLAMARLRIEKAGKKIPEPGKIASNGSR